MLERFAAVLAGCLVVGVALAALTDVVSVPGAVLLAIGVGGGTTLGVRFVERRRG